MQWLFSDVEQQALVVVPETKTHKESPGISCILSIGTVQTVVLSGVAVTKSRAFNHLYSPSAPSLRAFILSSLCSFSTPCLALGFCHSEILSFRGSLLQGSLWCCPWKEPKWSLSWAVNVWIKYGVVNSGRTWSFHEFWKPKERSVKCTD